MGVSVERLPGMGKSGQVSQIAQVEWSVIRLVSVFADLRLHGKGEHFPLAAANNFDLHFVAGLFLRGAVAEHCGIGEQISFAIEGKEHVTFLETCIFCCSMGAELSHMSDS